MKYTKYLILLITAILLAGCKATPFPEKLATPENLAFDTIITWDEVENATNYTVFINDVAMEVTVGTYYVISEQGEYEVYVIASAPGYESSERSATLNISIQYDETISVNPVVTDNTLTWDEVEFASTYNLIINGEEYISADTEYDLSELTKGVYTVYIQAVYPDSESNLSEAFIFGYDLLEVGTSQYQYSQNSTIDINTFFTGLDFEVYAQNANQEFIDASNVFEVVDETLHIKSSYLVGQPIGQHQFYVIYDGNRMMLDVQITDVDTPYIISSTLIDVFGGHSVQLQFELFGGVIYSINGTAEDNVLYSIDDNILTIEKEFIDEKLESTDEFVLSYVINYGDDSVIGYLFFENALE